MEASDDTEEVRAVMTDFADRTGLLDDGKPPRRYLWTDAFAVCNFLTLYRRTGEERCLRLALDLVAQVHSVLGRHREDDPRTGWISGFDDATAAEHPTAAGLRIGKTLNERKHGEPYDERTEWDRDGQYFHYLTKWMHALGRTAAVTGDPVYARWAAELGKAAYAAFAAAGPAGGATGIYWKMSIDLTRPVVPSMGLHDALDAYLTFSAIRQRAVNEAGLPATPDLGREIAETATMWQGRNLATDDPLGIGGLLFDACRAAQMAVAGHPDAAALAGTLLRFAQQGLDAYFRRSPLNVPEEHRLAFRELGLSIGMRAVPRIRAAAATDPTLAGGDLERRSDALARYAPFGRAIENFWRNPARQRRPGWQAHGDINMVMLATSLAPDEFLSL